MDDFTSFSDYKVDHKIPLRKDVMEKVLGYLSARDILALRRTDRSLNIRVHALEQSVTLNLYRKEIPRRLFGKAAQIDQDIYTFEVFFWYRRLCNTAQSLGSLLARHMVDSLILHDPDGNRVVLDDRGRRMLDTFFGRAFTRHLIGLAFFLEHLRPRFIMGELQLQNYDDDTYRSLQHIFEFEQRAIIRRFGWSLDQIDGVSITLNVLIGVLDISCLPLWFAHKGTSPAVNVKGIIILHGLSPIRKLIEAPRAEGRDYLMHELGDCTRRGRIFGSVWHFPASHSNIFRHIGCDYRLNSFYPFIVRREVGLINETWLNQKIWLEAAAWIVFDVYRYEAGPMNLFDWLSIQLGKMGLRLSNLAEFWDRCEICQSASGFHTDL